MESQASDIMRARTFEEYIERRKQPSGLSAVLRPEKTFFLQRIKLPVV
jgi:hypothetical protein